MQSINMIHMEELCCVSQQQSDEILQFLDGFYFYTILYIQVQEDVKPAQFLPPEQGKGIPYALQDRLTHNREVGRTKWGYCAF